ncbi:hypothetical protein DFH11DRAFT_535556 [Phellopilus nigrolimitatus]|nr:hypothetical protein DFH11DRAFT_535556 [Phellopilus nigrolimitatus]
MSSNSTKSWKHNSKELLTTLHFSSYSDSKLAALYLKKRLFKLSFTQVDDLLQGISDSRRDVAAERTKAAGDSVAGVNFTVPPVVIDLVVETIVDERIPLNVAAGRNWSEAFRENGPDLRSMSLVHRSWTACAQRGLRRRAVIPAKRLGQFLVSPLCGPWITEMILFWEVEDDVGTTKDQEWLLETLLERTPNIRSLCFHTSASWPTPFCEPNFEVARPVWLFSEYLSKLENLWLKHHAAGSKDGETSLDVCPDMDSLCEDLPKMRSLKFLSIKSWGGTFDDSRMKNSYSSVDWRSVPPPSLKVLEIDLPKNLYLNALTWLFKPRGDYALRSLAIGLRTRSSPAESLEILMNALNECLPIIEEMRLCHIDDFRPAFAFGPSSNQPRGPHFSHMLSSCTRLQSLGIFATSEMFAASGSFSRTCDRISSLPFPRTLEKLSIHSDVPWADLFDSPSLEKRAQSDSHIIAVLETLPNLRTLVISGSPQYQQGRYMYTTYTLDSLVHHMQGSEVQTGLPLTRNACVEKRIQLTCLDNAFPRQWI